jgi:tetratricopeptide (TPR) repeat protein
MPLSLSEFEFEIGRRLARRDFAGAAASAADCRRAWPSDKRGWVLGSFAELLADRRESALALIEECLSANPRDVQCLLQKSECLVALGRRDAALAAADAAAEAAGADPKALDAVGEILVHAREHARALEVYERAVAVAPADAQLIGKRAVLHTFLGHFGQAERDYERVLALLPGDAEALKGLTELRPQTPDHNYIAPMEARVADPRLAPKDSALLHFGLAKAYEDLAQYAASWRHVSTANRLERAQIQYEPSTDRAVIDKIIEGFPGPEQAAADTTGERPIFIVGLPRTGTTLVERIIGSHSQVDSANELTALSEAIGVAASRAAPQGGNWLDYAAAFPLLDGATVAREYLARCRARRGSRPRFSDKNPVNFFYCGPILRAFPQAHIVHVTRHPLAACYAIYKTQFDGTYPFSYDLDELGEFYIGYRRLMAHWHRVLPGRILDVAYEDLVTAQEAATRRLLGCLDLPFEESCLDFHLNPASTTTSTVDVRRPIYDSSLQQWKHFAAELAPLRARLERAGICTD